LQKSKPNNQKISSRKEIPEIHRTDNSPVNNDLFILTSDDSNNNFSRAPPKIKTEIIIPWEHTCDKDCLTIMHMFLTVPEIHCLFKPKSHVYTPRWLKMGKRIYFASSLSLGVINFLSLLFTLSLCC
jgi:hypothetical protein